MHRGGLTWRADYSIAPTIYGDALTVTGIRRIANGSDTDADGACVIYTLPFSSQAALKVAVVGDDLLHQLNDSAYNATAIQGYVEGNLAKQNIRTEVEGIPGRR